MPVYKVPIYMQIISLFTNENYANHNIDCLNFLWLDVDLNCQLFKQGSQLLIDCKSACDQIIKYTYLEDLLNNYS